MNSMVGQMPFETAVVGGCRLLGRGRSRGRWKSCWIGRLGGSASRRGAHGIGGLAAAHRGISSKITQIWTAVSRKTSKLCSGSGRKVVRKLCRRRRKRRSSTGAPFELLYGVVDEGNLGQSVPKLRRILPTRFLCWVPVLVRRFVVA